MKQSVLFKKLMVKYYGRAVRVTRHHDDWAYHYVITLYSQCSALIDVAAYDERITLDEFIALQNFREKVCDSFKKFRGI